MEKTSRHLDEQGVRPTLMGNPAKAKRGIPSKVDDFNAWYPFIVEACLLYTSPRPRD